MGYVIFEGMLRQKTDLEDQKTNTNENQLQMYIHVIEKLICMTSADNLFRMKLLQLIQERQY